MLNLVSESLGWLFEKYACQTLSSEVVQEVRDRAWLLSIWERVIVMGA